VGKLALHLPVERELAPGLMDVFTVDVTAGQFAHVVAEQQGVDVVVTVAGVDGKVQVTADSPNYTLGPEPASWIAKDSGAYQVRVSKANRTSESGRYRIELTDLREPAGADRNRIAAESSFFAAVADDQSGDKEKGTEAVQEYQRAASLWRELKDGYAEALCLHRIARLYGIHGDNQQALDYYGQALPLRRAVGDRAGEAETLTLIGALYRNLGDNRKALDYYGQALPLRRAVGDRAGEAWTLNGLAIVNSVLGEKRKALDYFGQALPLFTGIGDRVGEAGTLNNIGLVYWDLGEGGKALDYFGRALPLRRVVGDRLGEAATLKNIGSVYRDRGEKQKALDYYEQALPLHRAVGYREGEAWTLNGIGGVYAELGERPKALDYLGQALALFRATGDHAGEAAALNNIGGVYAELGESQKALDYYGQALPLHRAAGYRLGEADALLSIGAAYAVLGQKQKALDYYGQALLLSRSAGYRTGEAATLNSIGELYAKSGERRKALDYYAQALTIRRYMGDRPSEAETLADISSVYRDLGHPDAGIRFGKQAVNILQSIRRDNQKLPDELKRSYEKKIESIYRNLASLLVERQRFGEAEEVLNLLKDKEASDFIRRDAIADQLRPATLLDSERKALERYEQIVGQVVTLGQQKAALVDKRNKGSLTLTEAEQVARLDGDLAAANRVLLRYLYEQEKDFAPSSAVAKRTGEFREEAAGVQNALRQMGPDVVAIYTLVMPDKYIAMLVTSGTRKAYTTTVKEKDLNQKIFTFRQLLQNPASHPQTQAQELYRIVFPEGLRQDLDALHAKTIMWSIDSTLRYVPLAALHDGHDYIVKRFRNSLFTPASLTRLTESSTSVWDGTGFGVSEATANFSALPAVPAELHGIFRQNETETAPIAGAILLNAEFTRSSFENDLRSKKNSVVHIATHFDSEPGVAANSHLLLGDGSELSLADIEDQQDLFDGVEVLTLSACSTAFTNKSEDGREVDSFGTIAQQMGAKGVIASLWSVNDEATARLMETMYRLRQKNPAAGKSEALRLAQEQMANGVLKPDEQAKDWHHPFYWAPFILIGNWH
jgi:CHAT domain-containing protein/Tfp pilus assembly protein PilF